MEFTGEDLQIVQDSLAMRMCFLETGTPHLSWEDAKRIGKDSWDQFDIRAPTREQLTMANKVRVLWLRILQRKL